MSYDHDLAGHGQQRGWEYRAGRLPAGSSDTFCEDDSLDALERFIMNDEANETENFEALMRRDVRWKVSGSKGRRRPRPGSDVRAYQDRVSKREAVLSQRPGRPTIGAEVRVYVQTSIAPETKKALTAHGMTLAQVFDEFARGLAHEG